MHARPDTTNLGWLLSRFAEEAGVAHAIAVSTDGLLLAASENLPADRAEQLAAVAGGTVTLARSGARLMGTGGVVQTVVEMEAGLLFLTDVGDGGCLAVLAPPGCDVGRVGYEMTLLVDKVGEVLEPDSRHRA